MDDMQAQLLTGQLSHLRDSIESRLKERADSLEHHKRLEAERLNLLKAQIEANRRMAEDQEERIRKIDDAAIANRTSMTIMQAGQAALTVIAAAIAAWLGSR